MSKRVNPFSGGPQQLKTHVGAMEIANSASGHSTRKAIHQHTMQLLHDGAKKYYQSRTENRVTAAITELTTENESARKHKFVISTVPLNGELSSGRSVIYNWCDYCDQKVFESQCSFCDRPSCSDCIRACVSCGLDFCSLCTIINYANSIERTYCLSCVR